MSRTFQVIGWLAAATAVVAATGAVAIPSEDCSVCQKVEDEHKFVLAELCEGEERHMDCKICDQTSPEGHVGCHANLQGDGACMDHAPCSTVEDDDVVSVETVAALLADGREGELIQLAERSPLSTRVRFSSARSAVQITDCGGLRVIGHLPVSSRTLAFLAP
jgi:hypothetical protein